MLTAGKLILTTDLGSVLEDSQWSFTTGRSGFCWTSNSLIFGSLEESEALGALFIMAVDSEVEQYKMSLIPGYTQLCEFDTSSFRLWFVATAQLRWKWYTDSYKRFQDAITNPLGSSQPWGIWLLFPIEDGRDKPFDVTRFWFFGITVIVYTHRWTLASWAVIVAFCGTCYWRTSKLQAFDCMFLIEDFGFVEALLWNDLTFGSEHPFQRKSGCVSGLWHVPSM